MVEIPGINWSQFMVEIPLQAENQRIVKVWTTQQGIESWFLRSALYKSKDGAQRNPEEKVQPGDGYAWKWHGWPDTMEEFGEILEPLEGEFFRFAFGKAGIVSVGFTEKSGDQVLWLKQEQIPADEPGKYNFHVGCKAGWTFYLANLKSISLGGPDLRNKNQELQMD